MNIARYEKRIAGWFLDKALSWAVLAGVIVLCLVYLPPDFSLYFEILIAIAVSYAFYVLSVGLSLWASNGFTFGMAVVGIRTCHPLGERLRVGEALAKALMTGVLAMDILNSAYMLFTHTERSTFDRITKTLVIDSRRG